MVYPTITLLEKNENTYSSAEISIYDTDWDSPENPIITFYENFDPLEAMGAFILLLQCFLNQMSLGYDCGYLDAAEDLSDDAIEILNKNDYDLDELDLEEFEFDEDDEEEIEF